MPSTQDREQGGNKEMETCKKLISLETSSVCFGYTALPHSLYASTVSTPAMVVETHCPESQYQAQVCPVQGLTGDS